MKYKYLKNDYEIEVSKNKFLYFLYNNILGRLLLRIIYQPFISKMVGFFLNSRFSKFLIKDSSFFFGILSTNIIVLNF